MSEFHVYKNSIDHIFGTSATEAAEAYCRELGDSVEEYLEQYGELKQCDDNEELCVWSEEKGKTTTATMAQHIGLRLASRPDGSYSRLICTKDW